MFGRPSPLSKSRLNSRSRRISPPGTPTSQTLPGSANSPRRFLSQPRASEEIPSRSPSQPSWPSSPSSSAPPPSPGPPTAKQFEVEVQVCPREVPKGNQSAKYLSQSCACLQIVDCTIITPRCVFCFLVLNESPLFCCSSAHTHTHVSKQILQA